MILTMHTTRPLTLAEIRTFLEGSLALQFTLATQAERYAFTATILTQTDYRRLGRSDKGLVRAFLAKLTGYSRAQLARLIGQYRQTGEVRVRQYARHRFEGRYTLADIALLARVDEAHQHLSGPATRQVLRREYEVFGQTEYVRLARISHGQLYALRQTPRYRETATAYAKTRPATVSIGRRRKPTPQGQPGYLRVDSVHQGDPRPDDRGVYHINLVDEVTQWELVVCVPGISERFLTPALESTLEQFPFVIYGFHSDNGSEFINQEVAGLLEKLHIGAQTKSRPRHSGDNGLVETKNGAVIRKWLGFGHIPARAAPLVNRFYQEAFNPYLNYHRPCGFATEIVDARGRRTRTYPHEDYQTPYAKLCSLEHPAQYLRLGITLAQLEQLAYAQSDTLAAEAVQAAKAQIRT